MNTIGARRSEEHTSELQSPDTISYAVFCLKKKKIMASVVPLVLHGRLSRGERDTCRDLLFFFNATATTEIYTVSDTLSLHDALPILLLAEAYPESAPPERSLSPEQ